MYGASAGPAAGPGATCPCSLQQRGCQTKFPSAPEHREQAGLPRGSFSVLQKTQPCTEAKSEPGHLCSLFSCLASQGLASGEGRVPGKTRPLHESSFWFTFHCFGLGLETGCGTSPEIHTLRTQPVWEESQIFQRRKMPVLPVRLPG